VQFALNELIKIQGILEMMSEPAFVDAVQYRMSHEPKAVVAEFKCEHFGECVVYKLLEDNMEVVSEDDLRIMAGIANGELERIVMTNGWGSMTDHEIDLGHAHVPVGFVMEFKGVLN
jgi:hypothetical protein